MGLGMYHACIFVSKPLEEERLSRKLMCVLDGEGWWWWY
jgi:hypothetical protein